MDGALGLVGVAVFEGHDSCDLKHVRKVERSPLF